MHQQHEDAVDELTFLDDDEKIQYHMGDAFIFETKEEAEKMVEEMKDDLGKKVEQAEKELEAVHEEMARIKALLYDKLGDSVNLEE